MEGEKAVRKEVRRGEKSEDRRRNKGNEGEMKLHTTDYGLGNKEV